MLLEPDVEEEDWLRIVALRRVLTRVTTDKALRAWLARSTLEPKRFVLLPAYKALKSEFTVLQNFKP